MSIKLTPSEALFKIKDCRKRIKELNLETDDVRRQMYILNQKKQRLTEAMIAEFDEINRLGEIVSESEYNHLTKPNNHE